MLARYGARQLSDASDEISHRMVITHHDDAVGNFRVELLRNFALWLEQPFFHTAGDARLRDVIEQIGDFGPARQLFQHGAERAFHFGELLAICVQGRDLLLLAFELLTKTLFLSSGRTELR